MAQRRASFRRPLLGGLRKRSSRGYRPAGFRRSLLRPALVVALIAFVAFDVLLVLRLTRDDPTPAGEVPAGAVRDDNSLDGPSDATRGDELEIGTTPFPDVPAVKPTYGAGSGSTSTGSTSTASGGSTTDSGGSGSTGTGSDSSGGSGSGGGSSDDGGSGDDSSEGGPGGGG